MNHMWLVSVIGNTKDIKRSIKECSLLLCTFSLGNSGVSCCGSGVEVEVQTVLDGSSV